MCNDNNKLELAIIVRSKGLAKGFALEGLYPFKHVGLKITDRCGLHIHHVREVEGKIDVKRDTLDGFEDGMGSRIMAKRNVSLAESEEAIQRMNSYKGKRYRILVRDCERVAGIGYHGRGNIFYHRQLWAAVSFVVLAWALWHGYNTYEQWHQVWNIPNSDIFQSVVAIVVVFLFGFYYLFLNTSKSS